MYFLSAQSTLPNFKQNEFSVVRQHEEFIWLHDSFVENEEYAGYIVRTTGRDGRRDGQTAGCHSSDFCIVLVF